MPKRHCEEEERQRSNLLPIQKDCFASRRRLSRNDDILKTLPTRRGLFFYSILNENRLSVACFAAPIDYVCYTMRLSFFIISMFLAVCACKAQQNGISLYFSPDRTYRTFVDERGGHAWGSNQQFKWGFTAGANYERAIAKNITLTAGIAVANSGYQYGKGSLRFSDQLLPKKGFVLPVTTKYTDIRLRYSFYTLGLPVGVNYYVPLKKIKLFFGAGASINYLINVKSKVIYYIDNKRAEARTHNDQREYYRQFTLSAFVQAGIEGSLKNGYAYRVFPNFSYTLTDVMKDGIIYSLYPYSVGVGFGVVKAF